MYISVGDEIFIGAGKNVGINMLDQNRIMLLLGLKLNDNINIEGGYLSQTVIQGKRVNDKIILQDNRGLLLSLYFNIKAGK